VNCVCGYEAASEQELADHIGEMMIPDDDTAADGIRHAEATGSAGSGCLCGFTARPETSLDGHLLAVFTVGGAVGRDGRRHDGWLPGNDPMAASDLTAGLRHPRPGRGQGTVGE
jgi:hypothetical protein